nr:phage lysozyme [uncultured bacterium]AMP48137.1 phage lysozyme [uncultured bacterium]
MKCNQAGINIIKKYESLQLFAYYCPAKILTIGYGHTGADVKSGMQISEHMAEELLKSDLIKFEKAVSTHVKVALTSNEFSALVSLVFNIGETAFKNSTLLKRINAKDHQCAEEFDRWINAGGKPLAGLKRRRSEEKQLFLTK